MTGPDHPGTRRWTGTSGGRSLLSAAVGVAVGATASAWLAWQPAILLGWDAAGVTYLVWTWSAIWAMSGEETRRHSRSEDPSRRLAELIVLAAGVALLGAVGLVLVRAASSHGGSKALLISIGVASVLLSWFAVHTVFTLRYARAYFGEPGGGVDFNQDALPSYLEFAYLAFTIGMTFQVSDTDLQSKIVRRMALGHMLLSYLFGAVIIALAINVVASLLK